MQAIKNVLNAIADWIFKGKRLPILVVTAIVLIVAATLTILHFSNKEEVELVSVYLT